jgi:SAM-dependent methyltransferase
MWFDPMPNNTLSRTFGREAFGSDPANYHAARPPYPEVTWEALCRRANLGPGIDILEIGAGTGLATAPLLAHDPVRLIAVEPNARLAEFLRGRIADPRLEVLAAPFETVDLPQNSFDLAASATAFHWLDAVPALQRIHGLLRPGGAIALWWNVFGDPARADPFHEATTHLFEGVAESPFFTGAGEPPYALHTAARLRDLADAGFASDEPQFIEWQLSLDPAGLRALYATWSNVAALAADKRERLLDSLSDIALGQFAGRVERNMTTAIYTARCRGDWRRPR